MNLELLKQKWIEGRRRAHTRWIQLSNDDLDAVEGSIERLTDVLRDRYGYERARARQEAEDFFSQYMV